MTQNLEHLRQWIGRRESDIDYVTIPSVHRLAATLDRDDPLPKHGEPSADGRSAKLWAEDDNGAQALNATAEFS